MIALAFGLDSFEQVGVRSFKLVRKSHSCVQSFGIHLEASPQFLCRWVVKERNILIQVQHDQLVA